MTYEEIFSRSYMKKYDPNFYEDETFAYETMTEWLHEIAAEPHVKLAFSNLVLDDELMEITYGLTNSVNEDSDRDFVIKLFTDGFVICWMRPKVDSVLNTALMIGGNDEKKIQSNYKANIDRLEQLEIKLKKYIRNYGYTTTVKS